MTVQNPEHASTDVAEEAAPTGSPPPTRIAWAPVAKVNLLPMEIIENRRFRRTQCVLGAVVVSVVLAAGGAAVWAQSGVTAADQELVRAQAKVTALQVEQAKYSAVPRVVAKVEAAQNARVLALSGEVLFAGYLNELDGARPDGIELTGLTLGLGSAAAVDPLAPTGIGTLSLTGTAVRYDQVARWMEALDTLNGTAAVSLLNAARTEPDAPLTFSAGAVLTTDALSGRYQKKAG